MSYDRKLEKYIAAAIKAADEYKRELKQSKSKEETRAIKLSYKLRRERFLAELKALPPEEAKLRRKAYRAFLSRRDRKLRLIAAAAIIALIALAIVILHLCGII